MRAAARVFVFKQRRAVEFRERPIVARKMSRNPVNDDTNAGFVQRVNEKLKIVRRSVATRRRKKSRDLIAPRWIKRMFGNRHKFDVREAHAFDVKHERLREFTVAP